MENLKCLKLNKAMTQIIVPALTFNFFPFGEVVSYISIFYNAIIN